MRDVLVNGNDVEVLITPTYSGCPAMKQIEQDVATTLKSIGIHGIDRSVEIAVDVET